MVRAVCGIVRARGVLSAHHIIGLLHTLHHTHCTLNRRLHTHSSLQHIIPDDVCALRYVRDLHKDRAVREVSRAKLARNAARRSRARRGGYIEHSVGATTIRSAHVFARAVYEHLEMCLGVIAECVCGARICGICTQK